MEQTDIEAELAKAVAFQAKHGITVDTTPAPLSTVELKGNLIDMRSIASGELDATMSALNLFLVRNPEQKDKADIYRMQIEIAGLNSIRQSITTLLAQLREEITPASTNN